MSSLIDSIIARAEQSFASRISDDDSPAEFAAEMRTRLDQDMCAEFFFEDGRCKITEDDWDSALEEIYDLAFEFAYNYQEPKLSANELGL